jgi:hypothetical protein
MTGFWGMLRVAFNILPKNRATRSEGRLGLILGQWGRRSSLVRSPTPCLSLGQVGWRVTGRLWGRIASDLHDRRKMMCYAARR